MDYLKSDLICKLRFFDLEGNKISKPDKAEEEIEFDIMHELEGEDRKTCYEEAFVA